MTFAPFEEFWQPFLAWQGPAGADVKKLFEETRVNLRERLRKHAPLKMNARGLAVCGVVSQSR